MMKNEDIVKEPILERNRQTIYRTSGPIEQVAASSLTDLEKNTHDLANRKWARYQDKKQREASKVARERDEKRTAYVVLKKGSGIFKIKEAGAAFPLYVYMRLHVSRKPKEDAWKDLVIEYYQKKRELVFAQHQRYMADWFGVDQGTVSRWLKKLAEVELILNASPDKYLLWTTKNGKQSWVNVYKLGYWLWSDGPGSQHLETYFYEVKPSWME